MNAIHRRRLADAALVAGVVAIGIGALRIATLSLDSPAATLVALAASRVFT
ncbi:MAG: hypothetical protein U1F51_14630 [Burkholderiales bacterium]